MAKFIFKDDDGSEHEIKLSAIKAKALKKGDVVIANYEIGNANNVESGKALTQLKTALQSAFPDGVKVLVTASRNGKEDITLKIIKDKTQEG